LRKALKKPRKKIARKKQARASSARIARILRKMQVCEFLEEGKFAILYF
jgi:hypothetical protein